MEKFLVGKIKKIFFTIKDDIMLEIISGLVENNLYDNTEQKKIRIITWFLALLGLDKALEIIIKENEGSFSHKNQTEKTLNFFINSFNELKQKKDILTFSIKYYIKTIEDCLSIGLDDLAILIASLKKPYPELIDTYKVEEVANIVINGVLYYIIHNVVLRLCHFLDITFLLNNLKFLLLDFHLILLLP